MEEINKFIKKNSKYLISIIFIFICNYFANSWIKLESLYLDDLSLWNLYNENSFLDFIFNTVYGKIRPVFNIIAWFCFKVIGNKIFLFDYLNLLLNFAIAVIIFLLTLKLTKSNNIISLCIRVYILYHAFHTIASHRFLELWNL